MRAGLLKNRVTIQRRSISSDDEYGGESVEWVTVGTVFARIVPLYGSEIYEAQAVHNKASVKISIRYMRGLDSSMRFVVDGTIYDIINVPPVPDAWNGMTMLCATGVTKG